jgi:hypothetical protein
MLQASCFAVRKNSCVSCCTRKRRSRRWRVLCRSGLSLPRWCLTRKSLRYLAIQGSLRLRCRVCSSSRMLCSASQQRFAKEQSALINHECKEKRRANKFSPNEGITSEQLLNSGGKTRTDNSNLSIQINRV